MVANFLTLGLGEGGARLLGFVATVILARRLGPAGFGLVTVGLTLVAWFSIVVNAGTEALNVRDIARAPERFRELVDRVLGLRLTLSILGAAVFAAGALLLAPTPDTRAVYVRFAIVLPFMALNLRWMVLGVGGAKAVAIANVASRAVFVVGVLLLVSNPPDVLRVPYLEAIGEAVYAFVILGLLSRRFGFARPRIDLPAWRATLEQSFPLMVNALATAVVVGFDVVAIEIIYGPTKLGYYSAALKPVLFLLGALLLLSVAFLSSYSAARGAAAEALFLRTARMITGLMLLAAIVLSAAATPIVDLLYGDRYHQAGSLLTVLAWVVPIAALSIPFSTALIAGHRQRRLARNNLVTAGFTIVADLAVIPIFGLHGAAVVRIAAAILVLALNSWTASSLGVAPSLREVLDLRAGRRSAAHEQG
jgi:polysaccharide transporter, PST family